MAQRTQRTPNIQPNAFPATIELAVLLDGTQIGAIAVPQGDNLSEKGNVVYRAAIPKGWQLPGEGHEALSSLTFVVNGVQAKVASSGVHLSRKGGNPTVGHFVRLPLGEGDEATDFQVQVYATYLGEAKGFNLGFTAWPAPEARQSTVIGEITGLEVAV